MKDNARQDQGSTESLGTGLSRSATPARRFPAFPEKCDHCATKMLPDFEMQIVTRYRTVTYNFDTQNWSHFLCCATSSRRGGSVSRDGRQTVGSRLDPANNSSARPIRPIRPILPITLIAYHPPRRQRLVLYSEN
jgi:hypothetical protein